MLHVKKAIELAKECDNCYLVITHMHDDCVSGLSTLVRYMYEFMDRKMLKIVVPYPLYHDVMDEMRIKGILPGMYEIILLTDNHNTWNCENSDVKKWMLNVIPTIHSPELYGKCFGYVFEVNGKKILYSGDTCEIGSFLQFVPRCNEFYVDCSAKNQSYHLKWADTGEILREIVRMGCPVYIMHMDDRDAFSNFNLGDITLVPRN